MLSWRMFVSGMVTILLFVSATRADTIIQYDTEGVGPGSPTAPFIPSINPATGVTGIDATRGAGLNAVSASFSLNASGWNNLQATDYIQFGFNTTSAYQMDELIVAFRSSGTGPGFVNILYSKDGDPFAELASTGSIAMVGTNFNNLVADLSEIGVVADSLIFRIMVDPDNTASANGGTISSAGTFRFTSFLPPGGGAFVNPTITGEAVILAVPEPATVVIFGIGMTAAGIVSWRRGRRNPA